MNTRKIVVAVIGASQASTAELEAAELVGRLIAKHGAIIICGGMGGVMEAACRGASSEGGLTIGILPGESARDANEFVEIPIVTGVGHARNMAVVKSAHTVIAIGGSYGTLSEIAHALQSGLPVIGLDTWQISRKSKYLGVVTPVSSPAEAVSRALEMAGSIWTK